MILSVLTVLDDREYRDWGEKLDRSPKNWKIRFGAIGNFVHHYNASLIKN